MQHASQKTMGFSAPHSGMQLLILPPAGHETAIRLGMEESGG